MTGFVCLADFASYWKWTGNWEWKVRREAMKADQFGSVQSLSRVWLFATLWIAAHQASLSITNSRSLPKPISIVSVMPSNHLILCCPLLLRPSIFPSIRVFSNESVLHIRWPKYWSFSFSISPSSEHPGLISFRMDWLDLLAVQGTLKSLLQQIKGVNMDRRQQQPELNGDSGVGKKQVTREVIKLGDQQRQSWIKH